MLGPTVLGQVWPEAVAWMFTDDPTMRGGDRVRAASSGLFLLMFIAGVDARRRMRGTERRVIGRSAPVGLVVPFAFGRWPWP